MLPSDMFIVPPLIDPIAKEVGNAYYRDVLPGTIRKRFQDGLSVGIGSGEFEPILGRKDRGLMPWEDSAKRFGTSDIQPDTPIVDRAAYYAGRVGGTIATDNARSWFWRYNHPLAIAKDLGSGIAKKAGLVNAVGKGAVVPAILGGFGLATALDVFSGNTDPTNFDEAGRPKGYSALFPSPEDPTKSTNLPVEAIAGYVTGRKGKLLPWEQFHEERPDVSPERYQKYKEYQSHNTSGLFGLESADPVASAALGSGVGAWIAKSRSRDKNPKRVAGAAIAGAIAGGVLPATADIVSRMGVLKGTYSNLDGEPEAQLLGYKVPLSGLLATTAAGAGIYGLMRMRAVKNKDDASNEVFEDLRRAQKEKLIEERLKIFEDVRTGQRNARIARPRIDGRYDFLRTEDAPVVKIDPTILQGSPLNKRKTQDVFARAKRTMLSRKSLS
jgi:hypothetical protein